ncbi:hypothetical protein OIE66_25315 [Nonomuraea sp. NBC_01738]|uniref:hypothetical protein n=1 Tax=Nonomuraea sp. NBC_01738 TaxID=2976003 RepID=UPI002E137E10|nr:hypothetical protein OIE66_25315 [Nonomuraea sp. NBC_01738]
MTLEIVDPALDPAPAGWGELVEGRPATWDYGLLRAFARGAQAPLRVAVVRREGRPVAMLSASLRGFPPRRGRYVGFAAPPRALGLLDVHAPGSRSQKGWWYEPGDGGMDALRTAVRGLRRSLGPGWRGVVWREVTPGERLPSRSWLSRPTSPLATLHTPWDDLAGWYATLPPGRAGTLRSQARRLAADKGLAVAAGGAAGLVTPAEAAELKARNDLKHRGRLLPAAPLPLPYVAGLVGHDHVKAITYRADGRLIGLCLILDHAEWPIFHSWGALPVEAGGRRHLYFDAYVRMIGWAIAGGKKGLILGKGQPAIKQELGAELVPSHVALAAA